MLRYIGGNSDSRQPGCVLRNYSFVADFERDRLFWRNWVRKINNRLSERSGVIDVGGVGLRYKFRRLPLNLNGPPAQRGGNLQYQAFLRGVRTVSQADLPADSKALLLRLNADVQIVTSEREGFTI